MIVLGIDPGLSGGVACVAAKSDRIELVFAHDIATTGEKAKRRVEVAAMMSIVRSAGADHAFIERAQAMPDQGASSGFIYGRAVGALETIVEGLLIPLTVIESTAWKKAHSLIKTGKEDSRQRALRLFPGAPAFARKMDHNRAEAALIAWYGAMLLRSGNHGRAALDYRTAEGILARPQAG